MGYGTWPTQALENSANSGARELSPLEHPKTRTGAQYSTFPAVHQDHLGEDKFGQYYYVPYNLF